jgi:putative ABC transport system ATP-binding protein
VRRYTTDGRAPLTALDRVSLDIAEGEAVAVVGPSGSGKSTLLSLLGGLEVPTSGEVRLDGVALSNLDETARAGLRRGQIGFVFQADNLQPFLTAWENVELQASLAGTPDGGERTGELLDRLGIGELAHRLPDQLSGGQRQRVALARALVHRPRLLLADEPTGALDPGTSGRVVDLLRDAQDELGATLVVVTHDAGVAARFDRTVRLDAGRVADPLGG